MSSNSGAETQERIKKIMNLRAGKKGSITKRIDQLNRLVSEGGSRTKIKYLMTALLEVHNTTKGLCEELNNLVEDMDIDWIEEVNLRVDTCIAEVQDYIDARKDDTDSSYSVTASWIRGHAPDPTEQGDQTDIEEVTSKVGNLTIQDGNILESTTVPQIDVTVAGLQVSGKSKESGFASNMYPSNIMQTEAVLYPGTRYERAAIFGAESCDTPFPSVRRRHPECITSTTTASTSHHESSRMFDRGNDYIPGLNTRNPARHNQDLENIISNPYVSTELNTSQGFLNKLWTSHDDRTLGRHQDVAYANCGLQSSPRYLSQHLHQPLQHQINNDNLASTAPTPREFRNACNRLHLAPRPVVPLSTNQVDSWIDELDPNNRHEDVNIVSSGITPDITMAWLVQQSLPRIQIPHFDGSPALWVEFIIKFRDLVHNQVYLTDIQRSTYLLQHLKGEARRSVQGFANDKRGYVLSLKRLKYLFGQKSKIAQATLRNVTEGKAIQSDDVDGLLEFYYTVSDSLVTLKQLNYSSDLYSYDILRQAVRRLPNRLHMRWAEHSLTIRESYEEPNLLHFEAWLKKRVLAQKESYFSDKFQRKKPFTKMNEKHIGTNLIETSSCPCGERHLFWKCNTFKILTPKDRFERVKKRKCCFNCLKTGHSVSRCTSKATCFIANCKKKHHTTLHDYYAKGEPTEDREANRKEQYNGMVKSTKYIKDVFLQIVPVILHSRKGQELHTHALLDTGSQSTLLRSDVADKLSLKGKKRVINMATIKDDAEQIEVEEVKLDVSSKDGEHRLSIGVAYVVPSGKFHMPSQSCISNCNDGDIYTHLDDIELDAVNSNEIGILIGANIPEALIATEVRRGREGQPLAIKTKFGWTLFGTSQTAKEGPSCSTTGFIQVSSNQRIDCIINRFWEEDIVTTIGNLTHTQEDHLQKSLERFWQEEHCAILPTRETAMSREDEDSLKRLQNCTRFTNNHYVVPMLWKNPESSLPNNLVHAKRRFEFLQKRLRADTELYERYKEIISGYLQNGYARKMTKEEAKAVSLRTWYLPHHPVFNEKRPGKLRVVFDAAAKYAGRSLNDMLITGPDLLNNLVGVLIRFRVGRIALAADIEAMFHQVLVTQADTDSLRFLWKDDIYSDDAPCIMQMLVHIFGAKDSPTCANYALKRTARENYKSFDGRVYESFIRSFYVDDILKSVNTKEEAISLAKELMVMATRGGFHLTKFISNDKEVIDSLPPSDVSPKLSFDLNTENLERTLGIFWEINTDQFTFSSHMKEASTTKRGILKIVSSVFDPLGFVTPFTLKAKLLLQELWRLNIDWDVETNDEIITYWQKWLDGAKLISNIRINRCYNLFEKPVIQIQLHIFCDASELAYGPVAYLRFSFKDGSHECSFVMSKSKLSPIKSITLPRLELNAAVTAVRLYRTLIHEIDVPIQRVCFWTDSTLTLQYINNKAQRFKTYVANRVREILEVTEEEQWCHVPGIENPADMLTRGLFDPLKLMETNKYGTSWYSGPTFLKQDEDCWPKVPFIGDLPDHGPEIKGGDLLVAIATVKQDMIDYTRFSSWLKLKRMIAWLLRFLNNCRKKKVEDKMRGELSSNELDDAQHFLIRNLQRTSFQDEIEIMQSKRFLPNNNRIAALCPFIDHKGFLRVGGRLKNAVMKFESKHQLILPRDYHITKLIIANEHESNGHIGVEHVLANLRELFWIMNGRATIKGVIRKCFYCRVKRAKKMYPFMGDLPVGRLAYEEPPFTHCGVDLFGPILVKQGRKRLKRWGVLFTCLTVRCIHLEVVESADADCFINTLKRFVNRRGCPKTFYSDCGSNFKGATKELEEVIEELNGKENIIKEFTSSKSIEWRYNPPLAPHMGGAWERLIRSVKEVMTAIVKDRILTDPQLLTLMTEIENILNSRPLTQASEDINDLEALTPNHILLGRHRNWTYMGEVNDKDISSRKQWKQVQALKMTFWRHWRRQYLPKLTQRGKWKDHIPNYKLGELVILCDDDSKRAKWPLGRLTKVMPGEDGVVRVVEVKTKDGVYTRPVVKLCKLEDEIEVPQGEGCVDTMPMIM